MHVEDPLYGKIEISDHFLNLMSCAEFQRLKDVRLLNIHSPVLLALSDIRRYTHCFGVIHLAQRLCTKLGMAQSNNIEYDTFLAACILHDIGTPPFAHLLEYKLRDKTGWNHEKIVWDLLLGKFSSSGLYHQYYYGIKLKAYSILESMKIDIEKLYSHITGKSILGKLLAGTLDIDNMDNINRMGWGLGLSNLKLELFNIIDNVTLDEDEIVYKKDVSKSIVNWGKTRKSIYERLVFDIPTVAAQCLLSDSFDIALENDYLTEEDWFLTDEQILWKLTEYRKTRERIQRLMNRDLYQHLFTLWIDDTSFYSIITTDKQNILSKIEELIGSECSFYPFLDKGTFSKNVTIKVLTGLEKSTIEIGETSKSVVVSFFTVKKSKVASKVISKVREWFIDTYITDTKLLKIIPKDSSYENSFFKN